MGIRNCERCGRVFTGVDVVCPACTSREEEEFERVRAYLADHPAAMVAEVSLQTQVEVREIYRWVRSGRLRMTLEQLEGALRCERCGAPIDTGRFCPKCLSEIRQSLRQAVQKEPEPRAPVEPRAPRPAEPKSRRPPKVHTADDVRRRFT
ncbi:MAG: MerR family transcriptional regulator [Limnochordaceae bacterium]|nr:MerR family transcriptional regulator [Limnochordaceae bacterium]